MTGAAHVLWDVVEEHLDEAEFLLGQWLRAARSHRFSLGLLRKTVEARLVAHLDGLVVGGQPAADDLLWPACTDDAATASRVAAAASALLLDPDPGVAARLMEFLDTTPNGPARMGLRTAFQIAARTDLDEPLRLALYANESPEVQVALLQTLTARRLDPGPILASLLRSDEPVRLAAAVHAAAAAQPGQHRHLIEDHLRHHDAGVRAAALRTGMIWNLAPAWSACVAGVRAGAADAMLLAALAGDRSTPPLLLPSLSEKSQRPAAIFALGFTGFVTAIEACLPLLDDPDERTARLAVEAIAAVTNLPLDDAPFVREPAPAPPAHAVAASETDAGELPPLEEDLATDLEPDPADELPLPDAVQVRAWWSEHRGEYDANRRYLRGVPASPPAFAAALRDGTLRRSGPLACEVAIRSGARLMVPALRLGLPAPEITADVAFAREPSWR